MLIEYIIFFKFLTRRKIHSIAMTKVYSYNNPVVAVAYGSPLDLPNETVR